MLYISSTPEHNEKVSDWFHNTIDALNKDKIHFNKNILVNGQNASLLEEMIVQSAGSMNCAKTVYVCPELPGESFDPDFERFRPGLGLTDIHIIPHYNDNRNREKFTCLNRANGGKYQALLHEIPLPPSPNLWYNKPIHQTKEAIPLKPLSFSFHHLVNYCNSHISNTSEYNIARAVFEIIAEETDWFAMGNANNIMDNLGLDYIVVTMDNSYYGWKYPLIEDNVLKHIIPYMEENYNVSKEAKDRAFNGLSMGSMTTFNMFFDHPTEFAYFGAYSGPDMAAVKKTEGIDKPTFYFNVGTCDMASSKVMANPEGSKIKYEDFVEYLKENPMENVIDGGYIKGAHDWFEWSQSFNYFVSKVCWTK